RRAIHRVLFVPQRVCAARHEVIHVLPARFVPYALPGGVRHPLLGGWGRAVASRAEQRVWPLASGRRESRNAPIARHISPPRSPSPAAISPHARPAAPGGPLRAPCGARARRLAS